MFSGVLKDDGNSFSFLIQFNFVLSSERGPIVDPAVDQWHDQVWAPRRDDGRVRHHCRYRAGGVYFLWSKSLQWRHNERDGVSNHGRIDCVLNRLFWRI